MSNKVDIEAAKQHTIESDASVNDEGAVATETFVIGDSWYAKAQRLAGKYGVEQRGIERVPNSERLNDGMSQIGSLWLSANMVISAFAIGALAYPVFRIGFIDTILLITFFNLLGVIPVCFFSTFGPRFGMRQMVLSRFYFGWYGVKIVAFFNVLTCLGWSAVNVIVGAQLLHAVNGKMPGWAGIIVIAAVTLIVTFFGYKIVHAYERISWAPSLVIFLIILGVFAHSGDFQNIPMGVGKSEAGSALSFGASVFGFATGWTSIAADYTVYQPVNRPRRAVFAWTFAGLIFPLLFTQMLGAAVATATSTNDGDNPYYQGYESSGIGGLVAAVLVPKLGGFGEFCLVILALSIIANNCPNIYSVSLALQMLASKTQRVPRFVWTFCATLVYVAIAIPGYDHFTTVLEHFMLLIAYWLAIYEGVSIAEHIFFKRGFGGYEPEHYMDKDQLPVGFAALMSFCFGVMGVVLGMSQVWFVGPIGKLCGTEFGGDVGFELAFVFTFSSYTVMRYFEKRRFGH
ncbi:permease for cytosine/purines, uracil, thiamine, allantoin-domain-containing protein [Calycina marina]|uniref:Permease for cytosine/purines, uracil, thiamine, allantoin-domain-containing protein n=1 Tax=Calycina marina TaxID=1763456 RepID=A0A9P7ZAW8_9HELO|nr:permease for cytosine/purines, uracil, thiamine, allantoin-domain-containing protein [Calycina marina]